MTILKLTIYVILWHRVLDLEKKKEEMKSVSLDNKTTSVTYDDELDEDFDEYLDWRAKQSFN